jgi:hypothetical protein
MNIIVQSTTFPDFRLYMIQAATVLMQPMTVKMAKDAMNMIRWTIKKALWRSWIPISQKSPL